MTRAAQVPAESHLPAMTDSRDYPTLADTVGKTPLVRLQRMPGTTTNVILGKLEGNNPAGSVKDRPALSMIRHAQARGEIRPGDTLIEATSGNTGIALAMAAAIMGYPLILVMPEHLSVERRQSMKAFGAEIDQVRILVAVPEPTSLAMAFVAILGIMGLGRTRSKSVRS